MNKPTVKKAKKLCSAYGLRSKVVKEKSSRNLTEHVYVQPIGNVDKRDKFINTVIDMGIFTNDGRIKCK